MLEIDQTTNHEGSRMAREPETPRRSYVGGMHMGDPCTSGALDHHLTCGHKVITMQPEHCAKNCLGPKGDCFGNPRSLDAPFSCLACITNDIKANHVENLRMLTKEMEVVARFKHSADPKEWIAAKIDFMDKAWTAVAFEDVLARSKDGRFCHAIYVDEDYQDIVDLVAKERARPSKSDQTDKIVATTGASTTPADTSTGRPSKRIVLQPVPKAKLATRQSMLPKRSPTTPTRGRSNNAALIKSVSQVSMPLQSPIRSPSGLPKRAR